ncbi:histidine kinase [Bifidobacterium sp. DSM 109957]|uniref:histidine kinase n=1 Tax=Bifidobacterium oedipodis TaxID=2675322 RepID=A0A7Y0EQT4_9BIFI|nr:histidine kinase [Bifidobacterium sp. DSM 109957]
MPIVLIGMVCCITLSIVDKTYAYGWTGIILTICAECVLMLMIPYSRIGAIAAIGLSVFIDNAPSYWVSPLVTLAMTICASFIFGYVERSRWYSIVFVSLSAVALCVGAFLRNGEVLAVILYGGITLLPWLMGRAMQRWMIEKEEMSARFALEKARMRLAQQEQNNALARRIHDSVTNDLSAILLLTGQLSDSASAESVRIGIDEHARQALNHVHEVIDLLNLDMNGHSEDLSVHHMQGVKSLREICDQKDKDLSRQGIQGTSAVMGDVLLSDEREEFIADLLQELYTNILRHCSGGVDEYSVVVKLSVDGVRVIQTNTCANGARHMEGVRSGRGLSLYQQAAQSLGGHLQTGFEDGTWMLNCWIPV